MFPDTAAEMLAGVWSVTGLAPVRAFCLLIAGPDVEKKIIEDDYCHGRRENTPEKQERKLAGLYDVAILDAPIERKSVLQTVIVPNQ